MDEIEPQRPVYTDPETVAMTLGLSDPEDPHAVFKFSDVSNPSYEFIEHLIMAKEDEIDLRLHRSWRENKVVDEIHDIPVYQNDENSWMAWGYAMGGNSIQLRRDLRPWDPKKGDRI